MTPSDGRSAEPARATAKDDTSRGARGGVAGRLWRAVSAPDFVTELLQILKGVVAATGAWWVSINVLDSPLPFLAPWTALLTVHATAYRSLSSGVQLSVSSAIGVGLSFVVGNYLGVTGWTFALALLVGLVVARIPGIRTEGVAIATTAIFVLGIGFDQQERLLVDRMIEVGVGVVVGIVVNLLVVPPLRDQQAARYVDLINEQMGQLLVAMADALDDSWDTDRATDWFRSTEAMGESVEMAWRSVRFARESRRGNPRTQTPESRRRRVLRREQFDGDDTLGYEQILPRLDEGVSHMRHLARTLYEDTRAEGVWDQRFRDRFVAITRACGRAVADPDAEVEPVADQLTALSRDLAHTDGLPERSWPLYGSLITSLRHIAVVVDDVASARAAREALRNNPRG